MYFEKAGKENTSASLSIAKETALKRNIKHIVVASTFGDTGLLSTKMLKGTDINLIIITHNFGFKGEGICEMTEEIRNEIGSLGGKVHTGTMVLRSLGTAIKGKLQYSEQEIVNATLRMFGEGIKVCIEIVAMACDAGLIPPIDVIAVAGTSRGADTACIIKANSSNKFFDIKVREILAKPGDF